MRGATSILRILFVSLLLAPLAPLMVCIAIAAAVDTRCSPIFGQRRIGQHDRAFTIYKFRTMLDLRDRSGHLLPDNLRLTSFGRFLRACSLDELPQLWNVWKGDMALVGPRPLLPEYLPRYTPFQRRRNEVRPGITGWAQVNGRNGLTWEQKFDFDVWYVDHKCLWLDARVLWITVSHVLRREGISQSGHATMPEFLGSPTPTRRDD